MVVTIVVLLILAGVSINLLLGPNGLIVNSREAQLSQEFAKYKEKMNFFIAEKQIESNEFNPETIIAYKENLYYNTKNNNESVGIEEALGKIDDKYIEKLQIINGKICINTSNKIEKNAAEKAGIEAFDVDVVDGTLISSEKNLKLIEENGTITIPANVTKIGDGTFANVKGLKSVVIPGNVKVIEKNAFRYNSTLEKVVIQEGVEIIENEAFQGCQNLSEVILPESITEIGTGIFYGCKSLKEIEIPSKVEYIRNVTFSLSGLEKITFRGNNIKSINSEAFYGCKITEFNITENVELIESTAFNYCNLLENIIIDKNNNNFKYKDGILTNTISNEMLFVALKNYENVTTFVIPDGVTEVKCNLPKITKLIIPASITELNARNLPTSLTEVEISKDNTCFYTFENCIYTKKDPITLVYCYSKEREIKLTKEVNTIGRFSFIGATNITKVTFYESTEKIENQLFYKSGEVEVYVGKNVKSINPMFIYTNYNYKIIIDKENPYYIIEDNVLYSKNKTELITSIGKINGKFEVIDSVKKIEDSAFYGQTEMTAISLNKVEEIGNYAFFGCNKLTKIEIPATIKILSSHMLEGAVNTNEVIIHKKQDSVEGSPWGSPVGLRIIKWD